MEKEKVILREFKLSGIRCVSVTISKVLKGFYIGVGEDWLEGIIEENDLIKTAQSLKNTIKRNME